MREPQRNKAELPRFPQRIGNIKISDREPTPEEREARREEKIMLRKAKQFRDRKRRER